MQKYLIPEPNIHLILHNTIAGTSILVMLCLIVFLLWNGYRKTVNITLSLTALAVIIFELSHILGVSTTDSNLSQVIFMGNISTIFICLFNFHCVMASLGKDRIKRNLIFVLYVLGTILAIFYLFYPRLFIAGSIQKMYFPNYYVPGQFYWIEVLIFHNIVPLLFVYELVKAYFETTSEKERNKIKYFTMALGLGWTFGQISTFLFYNIPIDPVYGIYFPILFCVPFTYAVVNHDLLDIRIIAKRAFYYSVLVGICAIILIFMNFLNEWVEQIIPGIPVYVVPLISSFFAVAVGISVWRKVCESDVLKYDFISRTIHELRTPLTHIRLAAGELEETALNNGQRASLGYIEKANDKLIELTDLSHHLTS